jgi:parallel beta-helix repeat protein
VLALVCVAWGRAAVVYVDPAAPGPVRDGLSWPTACVTLNAGIAVARAGDTVAVAQGSYPEAINLKDGVWLRGGYPGIVAPNDAPNPRVYPSIISGSGGVEPLVYAAPDVTSSAGIEGFYIVPGDYTTTGVLCNQAAPVIRDNVIREAGMAIACGADSAAFVEGNVLTDSQFGVWCSNSSPIISGNLVTYCEYGIHTGHASSPPLTNNTVADNVTGLDLLGGTSEVGNNIVARNETGVYVDFGGAPVLRYNCVSGNGEDFHGLANPTGVEGNIAADPRFVDAAQGDYHLQPASDCVDAGWDTVPNLPDADLDARPRISGAHVDMGAYELPPDDASADALRVAAGLLAAAPGDMPRLDAQGSGIVDIADVVILLRAAAH